MQEQEITLERRRGGDVVNDNRTSIANGHLYDSKDDQ